jgi:HEAT repeats
MQHMPDNIYTLKRRIDEAEQSSEIVWVLDVLAPLLAENTSSRELYDLLVDAFQALRTLTSEHVSDGEQVILTYLLDYLEKDSDGTAIQKSATRQLRECLEEWIAQYPERESATLRQRILDDLLLRFQARPSRALCWTFSHVGYREERVVSVLWDYALREEDEAKEAALVTLTALGVPLPERPRLLEVLHRKLQRQVTQPLLVALDRLADPTSFDVVRETCFLPYRTAQATAAYRETWLALSVLTEIADAHDDEEDLQDRVWMLIAEQYDLDPQNIAYAVNLGGSIAPRCDSRRVVPTLLTWLGQASDEEKLQQRNPILSYRLEECVRPRQLASWQRDLIPTVIPILRQSACQDTRFTGRSATHEMHIKEAAWGTLLRMGYAEALGWFEEAVSKETNPYLRGELCDLFACFCLDPLPEDVLVSITERYDAKLPDTTGQTSGETRVRLGAVKVARSAASRQAFEALLECGLTFDGQPLLASVEALADVACALARKGEVTAVAQRMVETVVRHSMYACRLAAARALETLAREQELPTPLLKPLLDVLLTQQDRDSFERSIILSTLALQQSLPDALLPQLKQWAQERNDELALQSFSILAQRGLLLTEEALLKRLGLPLDESEVTGTPVLSRSDWRTHIIGLLYLSHPEMFVSLVADLIRTLPWASAVQLFGKLNAFDDDRDHLPLPHELAVALIQRVGQRQTRAGAELDLIRMTAHLIPEDLALEPWDRSWQDWLADARAALADALGTLHEISGAADTQRVRLLQMLMSDGHYVVRRAAYRGLQQCAAHLLQQWCWTWALSDERSLRLRAAEACAWLSPEGEQGRSYVTLFHVLATDPEPEVRQAALRTRQERRKRLWAQAYLTHIMQAIQASTISNAEVLAAWPYIEALKRVGDDTTIRTVRNALGNHELPPHIRHWYQLILKETSEGWEKAMKKWPQPGNMWTGSLEVGHGVLLTSAGHTIPVQYAMWRDDPVSLADVASWGGTFQTARALGLSSDEHLYLQMEDGRRGEILLKETNEPGGAGVFVGQGVFPH